MMQATDVDLVERALAGDKDAFGGLVDTVRYRVEEAEGTVRMWIEAIPEHEMTLSLKEYESGVQKLWELARNRHNSGLLRDGKSYRVYYSMLDEDARVRVTPDEPDDRWPASAR